MAKRPCLGVNGKPCRNLTARGSRCPTCQKLWDQARYRQGKATRYDSQWQRYSRQLRKDWVETRGWVCPGYGPNHPPHPSTDLVVDHDIGVVCRAANAIKANTTDRTKPFTL